jgi:C_GCAxxG_C_C family probable redox protein
MAGEVCGAFCGAVMAIGLLYGEEDPEMATYLTDQYMQRISEKNGAVRCEEIIGFNFSRMNSSADLHSLKGLLKFGMRGGKKMCNGVVSSAVEVLFDQLETWEN